MSDSGDRPKIIIDEDWKSQVERERDEAEAKKAEGSDDGSEKLKPGQLPPASFDVLISTMATQALAALGQFPDPTTGQAEVSLEFAQLQIDLLDVLQVKSKGNLSDDEEAMLEDALSQLRMLYVAVKKQLGK